MSRLTSILSAVALAAGLVVSLPGPASAAIPTPPVPAGLPATIEPLANYVEQTACQPTLRRGTVKLARLLARTYRADNATAWSSTYPCGTDGTRSEHYDGRAIDWMVDIHNAKQFAAAKSFIAWVLATDKAGNRFAMARRLGVMYLIYNNRMWGAWDGRWEQYNNCPHLPARANDNWCHRTHMHISLSWNGAMGHTSYWTGHVANTDYGPCRSRDLNWASRYTERNLLGCSWFPKVLAAKGSSATKRALVEFSGARVHPGSHGPAVSAVQAALHLPQSAMFNSATETAVKRFQSRHHLPVTAVMNPGTWRALLGVTD